MALMVHLRLERLRADLAHRDLLERRYVRRRKVCGRAPRERQDVKVLGEAVEELDLLERRAAPSAGRGRRGCGCGRRRGGARRVGRGEGEGGRGGAAGRAREPGLRAGRGVSVRSRETAAESRDALKVIAATRSRSRRTWPWCWPGCKRRCMPTGRGCGGRELVAVACGRRWSLPRWCLLPLGRVRVEAGRGGRAEVGGRVGARSRRGGRASALGAAQWLVGRSRSGVQALAG